MVRKRHETRGSGYQLVAIVHHQHAGDERDIGQPTCSCERGIGLNVQVAEHRKFRKLKKMQLTFDAAKLRRSRHQQQIEGQVGPHRRRGGTVFIGAAQGVDVLNKRGSNVAGLEQVASVSNVYPVFIDIALIGYGAA